jgi:hypothetical protein
MSSHSIHRHKHYQHCNRHNHSLTNSRCFPCCCLAIHLGSKWIYLYYNHQHCHRRLRSIQEHLHRSRRQSHYNSRSQRLYWSMCWRKCFRCSQCKCLRNGYSSSHPQHTNQRVYRIASYHFQHTIRNIPRTRFFCLEYGWCYWQNLERSPMVISPCLCQNYICY